MLGEKSGIEHIENARSLGKGCLFVTGHLGFFELGGLAMSQMGYPITALTLPEPSSELTDWRANFRKRWGVETVVVGGDAFSAVEITRYLRNGAMVALLCDRPFDANTVTVDLPHGKIPFSTSPVLLSLLSGAPLVAVSITRQPDGKFEIHADPPMFPEWLPEGREATLAHFTRRIALDHLVPMFARHPDQWHHFSRLEK
jgi:KDO2-lipid IV(A) lauroyltransferase